MVPGMHWVVYDVPSWRCFQCPQLFVSAKHGVEAAPVSTKDRQFGLVDRLCIVVPHRMEHRFLARLKRKNMKAHSFSVHVALAVRSWSSCLSPRWPLSVTVRVEALLITGPHSCSAPLFIALTAVSIVGILHTRRPVILHRRHTAHSPHRYFAS